MSAGLRRLSSRSTTFWKSVFTPLWMALFGALTIAVWFDLTGGVEPLALKLGVTAAWLGFGAFLLWWSRRLSEVWVDGTELRVSGTHGERRVPLAEVREIKESRFQRVKLITLELRRDIPGVGTEIVFPAPLAFQRPMGDHPVVVELRALKRLESGRSG